MLILNDIHVTFIMNDEIELVDLSNIGAATLKNTLLLGVSNILQSCAQDVQQRIRLHPLWHTC